NVCTNCHSKSWVDNWYVQYDGLVDLYNNKYAKPGQALYNAAKPLLKPVKFGNKIDFTWFELWHHEGRRARHGASMMGPDYTHWHGTYDLAKHFYSKYIPELEDLIEKYIASSNAEKKAAAENLKQVLDDILNSEDHRWFLGKMDPAEEAKRKKAAADFKARYD
ncbi:MAG: hydroxylamine oxidoreductase, partial [Planctomycetes bacterium]|nr:hydroxylamine oxidoreductase [Planctomycetota bacterium]